MISDAKEFIYFDDCVDFTFVSDPDPIPIILFNCICCPCES